MYVDGCSREECLYLPACTLCLHPGVTRVASGIYLYSESIYLIPLHNLLPSIVGWGGGSGIRLLRSGYLWALLITAVRLMGGRILRLFMLRLSLLLSLLQTLRLILRRCLWCRGGNLRTIYQIVDGLVLCYCYLSFAHLVLLEPLSKGCLCIGRSAANTQHHYDIEKFHSYLNASMIPLKSAAFSEAPPISPPSMSGLANSSGALLALQEPP